MHVIILIQSRPVREEKNITEKTKQKITNNKRIQKQTHSTTPSDFATTRENEPRDRIPHTRPSSHENYVKSILGSVSNCVVIIRTPPYWSVRMASCNFKLGGYCRSRNASNMTSELGDFYVEKFASLAGDEQNGPGRSGSTKIAHCGLPCIVYKLPTTSSKSYYCKRQLSLPATSTQSHEL